MVMNKKLQKNHDYMYNKVSTDFNTEAVVV